MNESEFVILQHSVFILAFQRRRGNSTVRRRVQQTDFHAAPTVFNSQEDKMANLNTTQIAHDLLGPSQRVYHQDLTTHASQPHLKIDKLGAGDFVFVDSVPAGQNPAHSY